MSEALERVEHSKPMVALITGASGFVGSHLAARLIEGGWEVHAILRPTSRMPRRQSFSGLINHIHDGTDAGLIQIVTTAKPLIVFHLASRFEREHSSGTVSPLVHSNVVFGTQLLEAMHLAGVRFLVNTGTLWQHYEGKAYSPVNLYAATKQAFEAIIQYYTEARAHAVVTLELSDTYGPDDARGKLLAMLKRASENMNLVEMSPGEQIIDLVHIFDVVEAYLVAAERLIERLCEGHERYSVVSRRGLSLRALVELIEKIIQRKLPIAWGHKAYLRREIMMPYSTAPVLPGWAPRVTIEDGIASLFLPKL